MDIVIHVAHQLWTKERVIESLKAAHQAGKDLSYRAMSRQDLALVSGAAARFGTYADAVRAAGIDYDALRKVQPYTAEQTLTMLRQMHQAGQDISREHLTATMPRLVGAGIRHFGSYRAAIRAAGLEWDQVTRSLTIWTRGRIIQGLRNLHRQGADLRPTGLRTSDAGLLHAAKRCFGSYRHACKAAGLKYPPINPGPWTAQKVLENLRERHSRNEDLRQKPMTQVDEVMVRAAQHYFGSYRAALEQAGIGITAMRHRHARLKRLRRSGNLKWTPEVVVTELRRLQQAGSDMRWTSLYESNAGLAGACCARFGNYRAALLAAGIEPGWEPQQKWTPEQIRDRIRQMFGPGQPITSHQALKADPRLWEATERHFGSWEKAVVDAGIDPALSLPPDPQNVLEQLRAKDASGQDVSFPALKMSDPLLLRGAAQHFGSYRAAMAAARLSTPTETRRPIDADPPPRGFTPEEVLIMLRRKHAAGTDLSLKAIGAQSPALLRAARHFFRTYAGALHKAGVPLAKPPRRKRLLGWSRDQLIAELQRRYASGEDLSPAAIQESDESFAQSVRRRFGTYRGGLEAAGIDPAKVYRRLAATAAAGEINTILSPGSPDVSASPSQ